MRHRVLYLYGNNKFTVDNPRNKRRIFCESNHIEFYNLISVTANNCEFQITIDLPRGQFSGHDNMRRCDKD